MNERTSERMHERANEGTDEATRERRNERARTLVNDRLENLRVSLLVVLISFSGPAAVAAGQSVRRPRGSGVRVALKVDWCLAKE